MAKVISRLYADEAAAHQVAATLVANRLPRPAIAVVNQSAAPELEALGVAPKTAAAYTRKLAKGGAVLVARTTYKPLGAAAMVRSALQVSGSEPMPKTAVEEVTVPDTLFDPEDFNSLLSDHPRFFVKHAEGLAKRGTLTDRLGLRLVSRRKERSSAIRNGRRFFTSGVTAKDRSTSVITGGRFMSRLFWPMPLASLAAREPSVTEDSDFLMTGVLSKRNMTIPDPRD